MENDIVFILIIIIVFMVGACCERLINNDVDDISKMLANKGILERQYVDEYSKEVKYVFVDSKEDFLEELKKFKGNHD